MILARSKITTTMIPEVIGIDKYYMLRDQSLPKPAVPTTNPPEEAAWVKTEPEYVEGSTNNLYTVDNLLYSDDTFQYTQVSLASSYTAAKQAYILAKENEKHFFFDTDGAHVTHGEHTPNTGKNVLITNEGMKVRQDTTDLASFVVDSSGNAVATLGETDKSHSVVDYHSLQLIDKEQNTYVHFSDLRNKEGLASFTYTFTGDGKTKSFPIILLIKSGTDVVKINDTVTTDYQIGNYSIPGSVEYGITFTTAPDDGAIITVSFDTNHPYAKAYTMGRRKADSNIGPLSVAVGHGLESSGHLSYAEGFYTTASGFSSHSEGEHSKASNIASHAEGFKTEATGSYSHAEGYETKATGYASHAEGQSTIASGQFSHAEGYHTEASGQHSHAQNGYTRAIGKFQTALGKYNKANSSDYSVIVGNGTADDARSNALTIDWEGNVEQNGVRSVSSYPTLIPASANLDNYVNPGNYYCAYALNAQTQTNPPFTDSSYGMLVFRLTSSANQTVQVAWQNNVTGFLKYRIRNDGGTWGSWYSLARGAGDLSSYLTTSSASSTYLTKTDASSTYLTKTDASNTYLTKTSASSTYLAKTDASNTYLTKTSASSTYATISTVNTKATQSTPTFTLTDTTNFTLTGQYLQKSGRIACVHLKLTAKAAITAGSTHYLGTLNPAPAMLMAVYGKSGDATPQCTYFYNRASNNIALKATTAIAKGGVLEINGCYCTAS